MNDDAAVSCLSDESDASDESVNALWVDARNVLIGAGIEGITPALTAEGVREIARLLVEVQSWN